MLSFQVKFWSERRIDEMRDRWTMVKEYTPHINTGALKQCWPVCKKVLTLYLICQFLAFQIQQQIKI